MNRAKFDLLTYFSGYSKMPDEEVCEIPSLKDLSHQQGVSISKLREQLSVAREFGFVEVQPRTGITLLPYSFAPAVRRSLSYALSIDRKYFEDFSDLRRHIEANYWFEAVGRLTPEDLQQLQDLLERARTKLQSSPPQLPHQEHRELHMTIFGKLENVFVVGLLEAYWDAYEEVGFSQYTGLEYLKKVWDYHRLIVDAILSNDVDKGYQLFLEHMDLLSGIAGE
ncbi:MAG: FCD domain-containing protein [Anaerolineales bacterium]